MVLRRLFIVDVLSWTALISFYMFLPDYTGQVSCPVVLHVYWDKKTTTHKWQNITAKVDCLLESTVTVLTLCAPRRSVVERRTRKARKVGSSLTPA